MTRGVETSSGLGLPSPKERRRLRDSAGLSYEEVAAAVGVTASTVRSWETGRTAPRGRKREAYARFLTSLAQPPAREPVPERAAAGPADRPADAEAPAAPPVEPEATHPRADAPAPTEAVTPPAVTGVAPDPVHHQPGRPSGAGTRPKPAAKRAAKPPGALPRHDAGKLPARAGSAVAPTAAGRRDAVNEPYGAEGSGAADEAAHPASTPATEEAGSSDGANRPSGTSRSDAANRVTLPADTTGPTATDRSDGRREPGRPGNPAAPTTGNGACADDTTGAAVTAPPADAADASGGTESRAKGAARTAADPAPPGPADPRIGWAGGGGFGVEAGPTQPQAQREAGGAGTQTQPEAKAGATQGQPDAAARPLQAQAQPDTAAGNATKQAQPEAAAGNAGTQTQPEAKAGATQAQPDAAARPLQAQAQPDTAAGKATKQAQPEAKTGNAHAQPDTAVGPLQEQEQAQPDAAAGPTRSQAQAEAGAGNAGPQAQPEAKAGATQAQPDAAAGPMRSQAQPEPEPEAEPQGGTACGRPAVGSGPGGAFDALYGYAAPALARQTYLLTGRRALALEAVERAFQQAWSRWPEVATDPDPVGWVRAAAYEYALSPWHQFRRAHRHPDKAPAEPADRILLDAVLALPTVHRRTVLLYDGVGLDLPDTAAETEASTPAAGSRLLHAHADLADRVPELAGVPPENRSALLHERLSTLRPAVRLEPRRAAAVRAAAERRSRRWARAALSLTAVIAVASAYTVATAPTQYEPPIAPGESVSGVPPLSGPQRLTDQGKELQEKLRGDPAAGPARLAPRID
ncbi:helix-turn-helix domain-containing protein [Streptomyces sp. NPDC088762]|uniref:helix-turn-helix domain-containing protein n=1 Tax=Streptomyces sp. NPDC088762 TaxID=3365891 RepID=UPI0038095A9D